MHPTCILGIETSCDETSVAIVESGRKLLVQETASSMSKFEMLGGVIPEEAAREQVLCMIPVLQKTVESWGKSPKELCAIAVTKGPGLLGSLLIGTMTARVLSETWNIPLIGVHHILGHLSSPWLGTDDEPQFPLLALSVSGGHTELWLRTSHTKGTLLGRTRDDAAGEAFDKGAELLGLPYPGGPALSKLAELGDSKKFEFPVALKHEDHYDFSFSGLKTSLRYKIRDLGLDAEKEYANLAAGYEHAICEHLLDRVRKALNTHQVSELHIVGGVSANSRLLRECQTLASSFAVRLRVPEGSYRTDNAAMIASAAWFMKEELGEHAFDTFETNASIKTEAAMS